MKTHIETSRARPNGSTGTGCCLLSLYLALASIPNSDAAEPSPTPPDGAETNPIVAAAPKSLAEAIRPGLPIAVELGGEPLRFHQTRPGVLENVTGDLVTQFLYEQDDQFPAFRYEVRFTNKGDTPIGGLKVRPFSLRFAVSPPLVLPRVRYLTGSQHYDATYPSRAFEVVDRAWMTPDHAKPIEIGGKLSQEYVTMMQFALQHGLKMSGFWVGFEWSSAWSMKAGFTAVSYDSVPEADFELIGEMAFGEFVVPPHSTLAAPKVHLVFFEGDTWEPLENIGRRYIAQRIAHDRPPQAQVNKVTYDHWFGIHSGFNAEDMLRQARRAAELGCEYFCLDAGWSTARRPLIMSSAACPARSPSTAISRNGVMPPPGASVRPYLNPGTNAIAVLVHHYHDGKTTKDWDSTNGRIMRHAPGLTARLEFRHADGRTTALVTDGSWRGTTRTRFLPSPTDRWENTWSSIPDRIDARLDSGDWTQPEFDDSAWKKPVTVDGALWGALRPRGIPRLRESEVGPITLIERSGKNMPAGNPPPKPLPLASVLPLALGPGDQLIFDAGAFCLAYSMLDMDAEAGTEIERGIRPALLRNRPPTRGILWPRQPVPCPGRPPDLHERRHLRVQIPGPSPQVRPGHTPRSAPCESPVSLRYDRPLSLQRRASPPTLDQLRQHHPPL